MMKGNIKKILYLIFFSIAIFSCIEEIDIESNEEFDSLLVVEATITNMHEFQEVKLSRTRSLDSVDITSKSCERFAQVIVKEDAGTEYVFEEVDECGTYRSKLPFAAKENVDYRLLVTTSNGRQYSSLDMKLTSLAIINDLYAEREFNELGEDGISIYVDTYNQSNNLQFYRYEYEETYKVIAPWYSSRELVPSDVSFPFPLSNFPTLDPQYIIDFLVEMKFRDEQQQICFNTVESNNILIANTSSFSGNSLDRFKIRFINSENYIISHRYSILVRQIVQSSQAYTYYENLKSFSESESLLSETQNGFIEGNIFSESSSNEKIVGFFEVASVDEKRIFFNYSDLFPEEELPPYYINCDNFFAPALLVEDFAHNVIRSPLIEALNQGYKFYDENDESYSIFEGGPFILVFEPCGDCTVLGKNFAPDFWAD